MRVKTAIFADKQQKRAASGNLNKGFLQTA
jgi:hypothetical protein